jgi:hypothetical protein
MRLNIIDNVTVVTLSRRNLLALLTKLDGNPEPSHKTLVRNCEGGVQLIVHAEENDEHYNKRPPSPIVLAMELGIQFLKKEKEFIDRHQLDKP